LVSTTTYTLGVNGVLDIKGNTIAANSTIAIDQSMALPTEFTQGGTVAGFQDDFTGATRDPRWIPRGPGGDVYNQGNHVLRVTTANSDPNHLLFEDNYNQTTQEVLARIKVNQFGTGDGGPRAGISAAVGPNNPSVYGGYNLDFKDEGTFGRHMEFLDDNRSWGPELDFQWVTGQYYWVRFKVAQNAASGAPDMFGKIWKADGTEPEPTDYQMTWDDTRSVLSGFAGISSSSLGGLLDMEVDYILIKAAGLPQITPAAEGTLPPPPSAPTLVVSKSGGNINITWTPGAYELKTAPSITGPWTGTGNTSGTFSEAIVLGNTTKFYQVRP